MNRILFWAVIAFALGEVAFLYAGRTFCVSMVFAMLILCVIIYLRKQKYASFLFGVSVMFFTGLLNISLRTKEAEFLDATKIYDKTTVLYGQTVDINKSDSGRYAEILVYQTNINNQIYTDRYKIIAYKIPSDISLGDWVRLDGKLMLFDNATNPGGFDMYNYYMSDGIYAYMHGYEIDTNIILKAKQGSIKKYWWKYRNLLLDIKEELSFRLDIICDEKTAGLYKGILLGEKNMIDDSTKDLYRLNGIAHILAISGLHISILGGFLYKLLRKCGSSFVVAGTISIAIIISYGFMTGFSMATLRAFVMFCVYMLSEILGKRYDLQTAIAVALFIILLIYPYKIVDSGTIISCVAMLGVCFGQYVTKLLEKKKAVKRFRKKKRIIYAVLKSLLFSLCVNIVIIPAIIQIYYEISLFSIIVNMFVMPTMSLLVIVGLASLLISIFSISLASVLSHIGQIIFWMYEMLCKMVVSFPVSTINPGKLDKYIVILYYLCFAVIMMMSFEKIQENLRYVIYKRCKVWFDYKKWHIFMRFIYITCVTISFGVCVLIYKISQKEMIVFLDVGQGDGILIRTENGTNMVIDGGSTSEEELGRYTLLPAIKYMGMANVDYWFVSHTDADHISGLIYILEQKNISGINIKNLVFSKYVIKDEQYDRLIYLAKENKVNIHHMDVYDSITDGEFNMVCCHPDATYIPKDKNDASLGLSYHSGTFDMLLLGDMGMEAELNMLNNSYIEAGNFDVIKIGHHGSKYSTSEEIIEHINPSIAIISAGKNNSYGHPHKEVLDRLSNVKSTVYSTIECGAVMIEVEKGVKIYGKKEYEK